MTMADEPGRWDRTDKTGSSGGSVRSVDTLGGKRAHRSRGQAIPRRELVTLLAYLETGSHKAAAHRLAISESTCRQRVSQLMGRVGACNAAQAVWRLRRELEVEERLRAQTSAGRAGAP